LKLICKKFKFLKTMKGVATSLRFIAQVVESAQTGVICKYITYRYEHMCAYDKLVFGKNNDENASYKDEKSGEVYVEFSEWEKKHGNEKFDNVTFNIACVTGVAGTILAINSEINRKKEDDGTVDVGRVTFNACGKGMIWATAGWFNHLTFPFLGIYWGVKLVTKTMIWMKQ
jgi:hypothetical protein